MIRVSAAILGLAVVGCVPSASQPSLPKGQLSTSAPDLVAELSNFKRLEIVRCSFARVITRLPSDLPSPYDTRVQLIGWVELTKTNMDSLKKSVPWTTVASSETPAELSILLPKCDLLTSTIFNSEFLINRKFKHGLAVITSDGGESVRLYFISQDLDHPIGKPFPSWRENS